MFEKTYRAEDDRFGYLFECGDMYRLNVPESPWRDLGFQTVESAEKWLAEHGYRAES